MLKLLNCDNLFWYTDSLNHMLKNDSNKINDSNELSLYNFISTSIETYEYLDLKAFTIDCNLDDFNDFNDFSNSNCLFMAISYDSIYAYMYFKNYNSLTLISNTIHSFTNEHVDIICSN